MNLRTFTTLKVFSQASRASVRSFGYFTHSYSCLNCMCLKQYALCKLLDNQQPLLGPENKLHVSGLGSADPPRTSISLFFDRNSARKNMPLFVLSPKTPLMHHALIQIVKANGVLKKNTFQFIFIHSDASQPRQYCDVA